MKVRALVRGLVSTGLRLLPVVALTVFVGSASAQTTSSSSAFGASVDTTLVPLLGGGITIGLDPVPTASGNAAPPYDDGPNDLASVLVSSGVTGQILSTGLLEASASSSVPSTTTTTASTVVNALALDIVGKLQLLTLGATTIQSHATIDGTCGALTATGGTVIEDAQVGGVLGAGLSLDANPAPNLVLLDLLGIKIVVNEQTPSGDGVLTRGLAVNALHVTLGVSLLGIGVLSGDIVIGHAEAAVQCSGVPVTPTPKPTSSAGPTPTPTPKPTASAGPTPKPTASGGGATPTPTPGGGATPTPTPGGGPTPTAEPPPPPTPTALPGPGGKDPYTDELGLGSDGFAGATLNPNGIGQLLYGAYYDVRPVPGITGTDAQNVNFHITNTRAIGGVNGGVLARVRFRESKTSREVYAFDIALSCGEDWAGSVFLDGSGASALPAIRAVMPVVSSVTSSLITTSPDLDPNNGGAAATFSVPSGLTADDVRRGYFEIIAEEQLPCEPVEPGGFAADGNTYARLSGESATPPNSLAGQVALVRPSAGASFGYDMPAIARFVIAGGGSIQAPVGSGLPDVGSCINWDSSTSTTYTGLPDCLNQIDLALSLARVHPAFDISAATAGHTYVVVTLPTKGDHCKAGSGAASPPFRCNAAGERIGCRVFDREENEVLPSPACNLPRELSILAVGGSVDNPRADARVDAGNFSSGWVALDYVSDPLLGGTGVHAHTGLDPDRITFIGVGADGFRGLPALTLVLQEYTNGNVGGSFGMMSRPPGELELLGLRR